MSGATEYCDVCHKDKPVDGFEDFVISWATYYEPAEYGRQCKDCHDVEKAAQKQCDADMEQYYKEMDA